MSTILVPRSPSLDRMPIYIDLVSPTNIEETELEQLSNKIRRLRFENGEMTQKVLAEHVGISRQTMNAIENCRHAPSVSVAIRIADVFQVSVDQLFTLDYEDKPTPIERPTRATVGRPPARNREPATGTPDRSPALIREPVSTESRPGPIEEKNERQITLADLKAVVGS